MIVRCTAKAFKFLGESAPSAASVPPADADWYLNLLWVEGRKCVLLTHTGTLFPVFVADVRKRDLLPLGTWLETTVEAELRSEGLPIDVLGPLGAGDLQLARTASRSVLGVMNDVAFNARHAIAGDGGLRYCDVGQLNHYLRRVLHNVNGDYVTPLDTVSRSASR